MSCDFLGINPKKYCAWLGRVIEGTSAPNDLWRNVGRRLEEEEEEISLLIMVIIIIIIIIIITVNLSLNSSGYCCM